MLSPRLSSRLFLFVMILLLLVSPRPSAADDWQGVRTVTWHGYRNAVEISNSRIRVVLCPEVGGRILEYALDGNNVLFVSDDERNWKPGNRAPSSAGRFDIGPELVIPRRDRLWNGEWSVEITGHRRVRLTSLEDPGPGVRLIRDFELDEQTTRLSCRQTIVNVSDRVHEWCHWSRTFAVGKGICLIPVTEPSRFPNSWVMYEEGTLINMRPEDPNIRRRDEFIEILAAPRKPKLGFDSYAGVIAYAAPSNLLFIKRFRTFPDRVYNEAAGLTISVWYPDNAMIELEPIGPRQRLQPGESDSFTEEWWLSEFPFPADGSTLDLSQIRQQLQQLPPLN
ncbi:MAG: hypothetical protein KDA96_14815 [Planctomycetaceae bacterium]|nr:hypothetical protein [Planctomycetaceae bacterium]